MKVYRDKSQLSGSSYIELLPGPYCGKCWNAGSIFIDNATWEYLVEPMILGRILDYEPYEYVEVPRALWIPLLDDLERLKRIALDVESVGELEVEVNFGHRYGPFHSDRDFPKHKAALLLFVDEFHEWLTAALTTNPSITILGL